MESLEKEHQLPTRMRAIVFQKPGERLKIVEKAVPRPGPGELLVKILSVSICASDLVPWKGYLGDKTGVVAGHEAVGILVGKHESTSTNLRMGDHVGFTNATRFCSNCDRCLSGSGQFCESGKKDLGFDIDGFWAEYAVVSAQVTVKVPEKLDTAKLAPLFCAGITAFAALKQLDAPARGLIGVIGLGGVGTLAVQFANALGFRVVGLDVSSDARERASKAGAQYVLDPTDLEVAKSTVIELTQGRLLAGCLICTPTPAGYLIGAEICGFRRAMVAVGVPHENIPLNIMPFIKKGLMMRGTQTGNPMDVRDMISTVGTNNIVPESTECEFSQLPEIFDKFATGKLFGKFSFNLS